MSFPRTVLSSLASISFLLMDISNTINYKQLIKDIQINIISFPLLHPLLHLPFDNNLQLSLLLNFNHVLFLSNNKYIFLIIYETNLLKIKFFHTYYPKQSCLCRTKIIKLMITKELLILALIIALSHQCTIGQTSTGASCPSNCRKCDDNLTCTRCCPQYFVDPSGSCSPCNDPNCYYCDYYSPTETSCTTCFNGYSVTTTTPVFCIQCSITTAHSCDSLNNCSSNGGCGNCSNKYVAHLGQCQTCDVLIANCQRCNLTQCLSCIYPYRLNHSDLNRSCVPCSSIPHCTFCSSGPKCHSCSTGYYAADGVCHECRYPCAQCSSLTSCSACNTTSLEYIHVSSRCKKCSQYVQTQNCSLCQQTPSGSFICHSCKDGYFLNSTSQCEACLSPCLTCIDQITCSSCINQTYTLVGSACSNCSIAISDCLLCYDQNTCIECSSSFFLKTNPARQFCISCASNYLDCSTCNQTQCLSCINGLAINSATNKCQSFDCSSPCLSCRNNATAQCLSCIDGYFMSTSLNYTCQICAVNCLICTSTTICTQCSSGYFTNNGTCSTCPLYQYYNTFNNSCLACPSHCITCDVDSCFSCNQFFQLATQGSHIQCVDICGDGIVMNNQCDIAPSSLQDGCSDSCLVQDHFACGVTLTTFNGTNGTINVNTSVCTYQGNFSISINSAKQILLKNSVKLQFLIQPYLSGMPLSSNSQEYLKKVYILTVTANISDYTVQVDQSNKIVSITVDYLEDLSLENISLEINFDLLSGNSTVLQSMTNVSSTFAVLEMKNNGCFGQYFSQSDISTSTMIYYGSFIISLIGIGLFILGAFTKELAGLEQMILFQTIFALVIFTDQKITMSLLSLRGFKYSLGMKMPDNSGMEAETNGYIVSTYNQTLFSYYGINFALYIFPLIALIYLVYKVRYKSFPFKMQRGKHAQQFFRGQVLLYLSLFNLFPLVVYSKLFIKVRDDIYFWDLLLVILSVLITIYALSNYILRPEIVGFFRSAFRPFGSSQQDDQKEGNRNCVQNVLAKRFFEQRCEYCYNKYIPSYYYIFIMYLITSTLILSMQVIYKQYILIGLQILLLLFLIITKPYFNRIQKVRAIFTVSILIFANSITFDFISSSMIPLILVIFCGIHVLLVGFVLIDSLLDQIRKKCNDRSDVVKKMFKVNQMLKTTDNAQKEQVQKFVNNDIIRRYNELQRQKMDIGKLIGTTEPPKKQQLSKVVEVNNEQSQLKEEVIIEEEHEYVRYQRGMAFFDKYGKHLDNELIQQHYPEIK